MSGLPKPRNRCPKCHHRAPRQDGIQCALCAPKGEAGFTITDGNGITHAYRRGCALYRNVMFAYPKSPVFNVGLVIVTCLECIAEERDPEMVAHNPAYDMAALPW